MAGRVIANPISGERIVIRRSGSETNGELLAFDLFLPPGAHVPATHIHPRQEERFTVVSGRVRFRVGRRTLVATPGETVLVRPGTAHWFGNAGIETSLTKVEVRPALRMEQLLERSGALGPQGPRLPLLSDLAVMLLDFHHELAVPHVPRFVVRLVLAPFAWIRRGRGEGIGP